MEANSEQANREANQGIRTFMKILARPKLLCEGITLIVLKACLGRAIAISVYDAFRFVISRFSSPLMSTFSVPKIYVD